MNAHSMLPCASLEDATHLRPDGKRFFTGVKWLALRIVDEQVYVDPDDVEDPDETRGEASRAFLEPSRVSVLRCAVLCRMLRGSPRS